MKVFSKNNIWVCLIASVLVCNLTFAETKSTSSLFREALHAEKKENDFDKAISLYQQVIDASAGVEKMIARALLQMAGCYEKKNEINEAARCYQQIVDYCKSEPLAVKKAESKLKVLKTQIKEEPKAKVSKAKPKKKIVFKDILPENAWKYISSCVHNNHAEALSKHIDCNAKIYGMTKKKLLCNGGMTVFKNNTSSKISPSQEILLDTFPTPEIVIVSETGTQLESNSKPKSLQGKDEHLIYTNLDVEINAGQNRCFGWQMPLSEKLTSKNDLYEVAMQRDCNGKMLESLFLVVPAGLGVIEPNEPYTNKEDFEDVTIYEWKNEISTDTPDELIVKLGKPGLQSIINKRATGEIFILKNGVYTEPIVINRPITIRGESLEGCRFEVVSNKPAIKIKSPNDESEIRIENLTVNWQLEEEDDDNYYLDSGAIELVRGNITINGCLIENKIDEILAPVGILNRGTAKLNLTNSQIEGPFASCVLVDEISEAIITDCFITGSTRSGISIIDNSKADIQRNIIANNRFKGIYGSGRFVIIQNNIIEKNGIGIDASSKYSRKIENNIILKNKIGIDGSGGATIANNVIAESSNSGISFGNWNEFEIENNIFFKNEIGLSFSIFSKKNNNTLGLNTYWENKQVHEGFKYATKHNKSRLSNYFMNSFYEIPEDCEAAKDNQGLSDTKILKTIRERKKDDGIKDYIKSVMNENGKK